MVSALAFRKATILPMVTELAAMHSFREVRKRVRPFQQGLSPRTHRDVGESLAHSLPRETLYKDSAS